MDLAEALAQTTKTRRRPCYVGAIIAGLDDKQRADVQAALSSEQMTHAHLTRALSLMAGKPIDQNALGKHRKQDCGCGS